MVVSSFLASAKQELLDSFRLGLSPVDSDLFLFFCQAKGCVISRFICLLCEMDFLSFSL